MLIKFIYLFIGFIIGTWTLLPISICLFFAIPTTNKLYNNGLITNSKSIISKYLISIAILLAIYVISLFIVYSYSSSNCLSAFVIGNLLFIIFGKMQGNIIYNKQNIEEYIQRNKNSFNKIIDVEAINNIIGNNKATNTTSTDKDIINPEIAYISLSIKRYAHNQDNNIESFFSLFPLLKIQQGYVLTSFVNNGNVYPYIKEENKTYSKEELEDIMYRDEDDDNISFSKNMDKIIFDKNNQNAYFELFVFNYYASLFFFSPDEYGGKIVMNETDKVNLSRRNDNNLYYSSEERQVILNTDIPRKIIFNRDGSISISVITTDDSYQVLLSNYKITKNNEIIKVDENLLIKPKLFY